MNKLMVEVYLPAAGRSYDVRIPAGSRIGEIIPLLESGMADLASGYFIPNGDSLLCDCITGLVLNVNFTPVEMGIVNGTKLMLI